MKAICYENTKTTLPNWSPNDYLHQKLKFGYAYEINNFFVHFYGSSMGIQSISTGLTVIEKNKNGISLEKWVEKTFGAKNIKKMKTEVGEVKKGIWEPGLYYADEIYNSLDIDEKESLEERQSLYMIIKKLDDILLYIEPSDKSLKVYSHELRNLLILSCTEVENQMVSLLKKRNITPIRGQYKMNDYVKLVGMTDIKKYKIIFENYDVLNNVVPFKLWSVNKPSQSLKWYHAYNLTKHNRSENFSQATFLNVINSVAANIILYCIRFSPYSLLHGQDMLSSYIKQIVNIEFCKECKQNFYIPLLKIPKNCREDLFVFDSYEAKFYEKWKQV